MKSVSKSVMLWSMALFLFMGRCFGGDGGELAEMLRAKVDELVFLVYDIKEAIKEGVNIDANTVRAQGILDDIRKTTPEVMDKMLRKEDSQTLLTAWAALGGFYSVLGNSAQAKKLLEEGKESVRKFKKISVAIQKVLEDEEFGQKLASISAGAGEPAKPAVPAGAGDSLERQQRQKARDFMEEAQKMQAGKGALTDAEFYAIDDKYNNAIKLFDKDEWRGYGFDILVDAYTARGDLREKNKRFIEMLAFEFPAGRIREVAAKITPEDIARIKLEGYDAKAQFARYKKLPDQLSAAIAGARAELAKPFATIAEKFATADIAVLEKAINEYNTLAESVGGQSVQALTDATEESGKPYINANFDVMDHYLNKKNLAELRKLFDREIFYEIAKPITLKKWPEAKTEFTKRDLAFKALEEASKAPVPGTPVDSAALRDALQNLANALDGVQGNL